MERTETVYVGPPERWHQPLENPELRGDTNEALRRLADERGDVIDQCNVRLDDYRWFHETFIDEPLESEE